MKPILRFLPRSPRFYLPTSQSPTYYNLAQFLKQQGWQSTSWRFGADFSDSVFQFDSQVAETLEFKHLLAQFTAEHCPDLMPETYVIDDCNWSVVLNQLAEREEFGVWILKPSKLNNGKFIKLFDNLYALESHFLSSNRLGGEQVLQRYVICPDLLRGHKYSIRLFVVMTSNRGCYLYPQGYLNVALQEYTADHFEQLNIHLTNEHLQDDAVNTVQIPTDRWEYFATILPQLKAQLQVLFQTIQQQFPQAFGIKNKTRLAIFGVDFLLDNQKRPYLLEANHGPCFPISDNHPLQQYLYAHFWRAFIEDFVNPKPPQGLFFLLT